jgi:hypothetical protein
MPEVMVAESEDTLLSVTKELLTEYKKATEVNVGLSRIVRETHQVVNDIHVLVNSEHTAAVQRELNATRRELILLKELGRPVNVIETTEQTITELEQTLQERDAAQKRVDASG